MKKKEPLYLLSATATAFILSATVSPKDYQKSLKPGLFLKRQDVVAEEFAEFISARLLTPAKIWQDISNGPRSEAVENLFINVLQESELGFLLFNANESEWRVIAEKIRTALPEAAVPTHGYLEKALDLCGALRQAMMKMSSAQFEKVLHPIFQEDEATLIAVGTALGAASGLLQAPFY